MAEPAIETWGLTKVYGHTHALADVDLRIPRGVMAGLLGPDGAGKTTAIKLLLGLRRPTVGGGRALGLDIVRQSRYVRQRVGYLPQGRRFDGRLTIYQVVRFAAAFGSGPARRQEERVRQALDGAGLSGHKGRRVGSLTPSELVRLGLAQATVIEPELLVLDEPVAGLDPEGRQQVLDILAGLRGSATVLVATHSIEDVRRGCDHLVVLRTGRLLTQGPIEQVLRGHGVATFDMRLIGVTEGLAERVRRAYWVAGLTSSVEGGLVRWRVNVTDVELARAWLPRLILSDNNVQLVEYGPERQDLENVFGELVRKEDQDGR